MDFSKKKCEYCGRSLVAIGKSRKNGKNHSDWESRNLHKGCWCKIKKYNQLKEKYQ